MNIDWEEYVTESQEVDEIGLWSVSRASLVVSVYLRHPERSIKQQ